MTNHSFKEKTIPWSSVGEFQKDDFIYRGHRCAGWPLETSLERACKRTYESLDKAAVMEKTLLREFRRRLHHYTDNVPNADEPLRWLSLMQHHGAPTRLLDWTYSIYVASYFALEYAGGACAVWKINKEWLKDEGCTLFHKDSRGTSLFREKADEAVEKQFKVDVVERHSPLAAVIQVNPFQLDERLTIQKGVFLYPCDASQSFETNLRAMRGCNDPSKVLKLIISFDERRLALKTLHSMNISRATLFPGLDGFAQSLKVYHPLL